MQVYSYVMTIMRNQSMAEEITQNTFFKAMTAKKKFEGRSNELSWLCGIAKHLAMDEHRKNAKIYEFDESAESIDCLLYTSSGKSDQPMKRRRD